MIHSVPGDFAVVPSLRCPLQKEDGQSPRAYNSLEQSWRCREIGADLTGPISRQLSARSCACSDDQNPLADFLRAGTPLQIFQAKLNQF